jgi:hypothetical protein
MRQDNVHWNIIRSKGLELRNMECRMNLGSLRKVELIWNTTNFFQDFIWAKVLVGELRELPVDHRTQHMVGV